MFLPQSLHARKHDDMLLRPPGHGPALRSTQSVPTMHVTHRSPMKSSALKKLTAAVASAMVLMSAAHAAGLGKLTVLSALGQPLRAEIELTAVSPRGSGGPVGQAGVARSLPHRQHRIQSGPAVAALRRRAARRPPVHPRQLEPAAERALRRHAAGAVLEQRPPGARVHLPARPGRTARDAVGPGRAGRTRRRPRRRARKRRAPRTAAPAHAAACRGRASAARPAQPPADNAERDSRRARTARARRRRRTTASSRATAWAASPAQLKPADVSLDMMLVALYRANPDAFIGNNMNRLKSGRILSVPARRHACTRMNDGEAHGVVVAHAADFNAYRNKLAGQVGAAEPVKAPQAGQSAGGKITAKVEERPTAANESQDQLRLSKAAPAAPAGKGATMSAEDTHRQAEGTGRRPGARQGTRAQRRATSKSWPPIKNKGGAEAQAERAAAPAARRAARPRPPRRRRRRARPSRRRRSCRPSSRPPSRPRRRRNRACSTSSWTTCRWSAAARPRCCSAACWSPSAARRRTSRSSAEPSILGVPSEPAHSLFAETGGQSVDTNNSVFNSSFAPSASQLDTNEVDPVAEADVYIAYGRDAQAEEILKEALRTHPERYPVRLKLLEIYAARKDQRAFETQAGELYSMTRGQGEEWAQAAALGLSIDPLNPLYAQQRRGRPRRAPSDAARRPAGPLSMDLDDAFAAAATTSSTRGRRCRPRADELRPALRRRDGDRAAGRPGRPQPHAGRTADDEHTLDFDLGGLPSSRSQAGAAGRAAPRPPADDDRRARLRHGRLRARPQPPAAACRAGRTAAAPARPRDDPLDFSFDMDFAAPAANPVPQPVAAGTLDEHTPSTRPAFGRRRRPPAAAAAEHRHRHGQPGARIRPARPADRAARRRAGHARPGAPAPSRSAVRPRRDGLRPGRRSRAPSRAGLDPAPARRWTTTCSTSRLRRAADRRRRRRPRRGLRRACVLEPSKLDTHFDLPRLRPRPAGRRRLPLPEVQTLPSRSRRHGAPAAGRRPS